MRALKNTLLSAFFLAGVPALAQNAQAPIPVPQLDPVQLARPSIQFEWGEPASAKLIPHGPGARNGQIWIRNTGHSIRIIGEVDGPQPVWPTDKNSILSKDHVEVWLAGPADVDMPPLSWGGGDGAATTEEDCKDVPAAPSAANETNPVQECRDWFETQLRDYRPLFTRLFVRQWLLAPRVTVEAFATPAYESLSRSYGLDLTAAKPNASVRLSATPCAGGGNRFEIDIPYDAFPPLNATQISELRLMVDVFSAAPAGRKEGAFSTTSSARIYGRPETFNVLHLEPPLLFEVNPCRSELNAENNTRGTTEPYPMYSTYPVWFVPGTGNAHAKAAFHVGDYWPAAQPAWDDRPPDVTPTISPFQYFWHSLGADEYVCGPNLTYRKGDAIREFPMTVSEDGFDAKRTAGGTVLIKVGPRVWNPGTNSQCGACPRTDLEIYAIDKNMNLITLLSLGTVIGGGSPPWSQDFTVSADWSKVVEYDATQNEGGDEAWSAVTYCRGDLGYAVCDRKQDVKPPEPPVIRQLLGSE